MEAMLFGTILEYGTHKGFNGHEEQFYYFCRRNKEHEALYRFVNSLN